MPVAAVEIEVSLQAYEQQARDGGHWDIFPLQPWEVYFLFLFFLVIATCAELGIAVVAYSYAFLSPSSPLPDFQQPSWPWLAHWSYQEPFRPGRRRSEARLQPFSGQCKFFFVFRHPLLTQPRAPEYRP